MNLLYEYICGVEPTFTSADFDFLTKDFRTKHFKKVITLYAKAIYNAISTLLKRYPDV